MTSTPLPGQSAPLGASVCPAGANFSLYSRQATGLALGVSYAVWIGVPRFGGAKTAGFGMALFGLANTIFVFIWTDGTPGNYVGYVLLIHGIGTGLLLAGASLLSTGTLDRRFQNEAASS